MRDLSAQTKALQLAYLDLLIAVKDSDTDQHRAASRAIVALDQSDDAGTFRRALEVVLPILSERAAVAMVLGLVIDSPHSLAEARNGLL